MSQHGGAAYPAPFVVEAWREHKQSLILLHGRGSNGEEFGAAFLASQTTAKSSSDAGECSSSTTFADVFPDMKFVFPTARKRRAKWYNRATINQWFDSVPIDEQDAGVSQEQEEWQLEGLRQSQAFLKSLVDEEVGLVGASNVFIGGLSQGSAMSLHLLLSYDGPSPLAGFVGMSGWLPFADALEEAVRPRDSSTSDQDDGEDDFDPFATSDSEDGDGELARHENVAALTIAAKVSNLIRDNMDLPPVSSSRPCWLSIPVFLGHGKSDEKVSMAKGLRASRFLRDVGMEVTWREYDEGHWYAVPNEIDDIVGFIRACSS